MKKFPEYINSSTYGQEDSNPYKIDPKMNAHLSLERLLDEYSGDVVRENESLKYENKNLRNENAILKEECKSKDETIRTLLSQIGELTSTLKGRSIKKCKTIASKTSSTFKSLIQTNNEKALPRLHELIDGKKGKDVGAVLTKAVQDHIIIRFPTQKEYESEFILYGTWRAITNYSDYSIQNVKSAADNITII